MVRKSGSTSRSRRMVVRLAHNPKTQDAGFQPSSPPSTFNYERRVCCVDPLNLPYLSGVLKTHLEIPIRIRRLHTAGSGKKAGARVPVHAAIQLHGSARDFVTARMESGGTADWDAVCRALCRRSHALPACCAARAGSSLDRSQTRHLELSRAREASRKQLAGNGQPTHVLAATPFRYDLGGDRPKESPTGKSESRLESPSVRN